MQTLPPGVSLILYEALYSCRDYPGFGWSKEAYKLAMRHDLASFCRQNSKEEVGKISVFKEFSVRMIMAKYSILCSQRIFKFLTQRSQVPRTN